MFSGVTRSCDDDGGGVCGGGDGVRSGPATLAGFTIAKRNAGGAPGSTAPGAGSVGSSLPVHHAVIYVIGGAAVALLAIGFVFRRSVGSTSS